MVWSSRRATLVLAAIFALAGLSTVGHLAAQVIRPRPPIGGPGVPPNPMDPKAPVAKPAYDLGNLTLPKDERLADRIEFANERIKAKDWPAATRTLQDLVGRDGDVFIPVTRKTPDGSDTTVYVSVKKEAARLVSILPKAGRDFYELTYGPKAQTMFEQARDNNDFRQMAQAMSLYLYTPQGAQAAAWCGTWMLDRAEFQGASRFYSILINRSGIAALKDKQLLKASYAFHHAGDIKSRDLVFKELARRGSEFRLREEVVSATDIQDAVSKMTTKVSLLNASDSPVYRGGLSRTAMLQGGAPFLEPVWKRGEMAKSDATTNYIRQAETALQSKNLPLFTSFAPVTATMTRGEKKVPLIIYRSFWGIHVVDMKTGKLVWDSKSDWSLDSVLGATGKERDSYKVSAYTTWLGHYLQQTVRPQIVFENSVLSTLSADTRNVYAVEDMPVPPPQHMVMFDPRFGGGGYNWGADVTAAINHNKLIAYDLTKEGKVAWEIGGKDEKMPLSDTFFLSAPLPLNNQLFVLTEKQQELSLVTLDPATGKVIRQQPMATTKDLKLTQDPIRRTQACHLAYGEGILIIPTNAGAVFGVDLLSNSLLWAYPYRKKGEAAKELPRYSNPPAGWIRLPDGRVVKAGYDIHWQVTAPAVSEGKVVFTAPDETDIHCVSLRDGGRVWSVPRRPGDLYMAGVYKGKVIIVGKSRTRALSLARGEVLWELDTGLPSGQGAASAPNADGEVIYYLPVREAANTREPEICAINVDRGLIHAHTRSRKKEVPGNLLFYEGSVLSQTHQDVTAYPQLEIKLAEMDRLVKANPDDPIALTDRGDYLLDKGDLGGAIADFRRALKNAKIPEATQLKARAKLYDAFTEYFQRNFDKAEEFIKEYEDICKIDLTGKTGAERSNLELEMRRRRANYLCLVGKGKEQQGKLVEAFEKYLELGTEARKDELIQVVDEPSVKAAPDVWSQGRIASMVAGAQDAKQKKALEDLITQKWSALKASKNPPLDDLRRFVGLFGSLFGVGKEARLALAERLMEDTDINSMLEAEQQLSLLRADREQPEVAARAIEALARLNTRKGLLEDAAYYYRLLGEKYPKISVDGKTGADYLEDLATDKRFLPYLDQVGRYTIKGKVDLRHDENRGYHSTTNQVYQFGHSGESLPFFLHNKLALTLDYQHQLKMTDTNTGEERWKVRLTPTQFQTITSAIGNSGQVRFNFQSLGHLVVLQLGHMVYAVDPMGKGRVLWEKNLSSLPGGVASYNNLSVDPRDNAVVLAYSDGWMQRLGQTGPLQGGIITLQKRDELMAIDPISGRTLWTRTDVSSRSHVFGDDQHVYTVGLGEDGKTASGTRVFRAYDGVSVRVPDFSGVFQTRLRHSGRTILASSTNAQNALTLRLYDIVEGKNVWEQKFATGTIMTESEDSHLIGVIEPDTTVRVFDVTQRKEVMTSKLAAASHVAKAKTVYLVADPDFVFLAVNGEGDPNVPVWGGGVQSNVLPASGLRSVPVNGMVYAFNRKNGKIQWYTPVENQQMVLSQFDDLPMVLFTSRYQYLNPPPNRVAMWKYACIARAKHNGKLWYDNSTLPPGMYFHALTMDYRTGKVEFTGQNLKVTMTATPK